MKAHVLALNTTEEEEDQTNIVFDQPKSAIVNERQDVVHLWTNGAFGSSTRSTRYKPAFIEDESKRTGHSTSRKKRKLMAMREDDSPSESLQLNLMEALYLREKGIISALVGIGDDLSSIDAARQAFQERYANSTIGFDQRYLAYSKFRGANWVPKSGAQYSCDYVLYRTSPDVSHSRYCVTLTSEQEPKSMRTIFCLLRVAEQTRKAMVLCDDKGKCLKLTRWVLKHEQVTANKPNEDEPLKTTGTQKSSNKRNKRGR